MGPFPVNKKIKLSSNRLRAFDESEFAIENIVVYSILFVKWTHIESEKSATL